MAIELVTGKAGVPHVDSEDVGAFNAYSLGSGAYIMDGCEVMAKSANSISIAAGEILWEGRHIRVKGSGESLAVDNGQTGYNRRDLITLNYAKDSNGIESASFAVVKGTATTGTAADPSVKVGSILAGDTSAVIPFARITLSGLSVAEPTVLLGSLPSLSSLRDSVSHTKLSVVDVKPGFTIEAIKLPFGVFVSIGGAGSPLISSGEQWGYKIARIPELVGASLSGICGFMWTQYANHNDAVWVSVDKNTGALNVDYKSETQDWIYTFHASGMLLFN